MRGARAMEPHLTWLRSAQRPLLMLPLSKTHDDALTTPGHASKRGAFNSSVTDTPQQ
uniref:Uncharacterized protein n=1 Tax=Oryza sativa subsp. japonica TaxID=39947 RepID=Q6L5C1_ORYSJ|nr:hypothetical protein [Oryza sativa Japonica Group]